MSEWQTYTDQVVHKMDYDNNAWLDTNVCKAAAIYGPGDGGAWQAYAWTGDFPDLKEVDVTVEGLGGEETHKVDEIHCAREAAKGNRNPSKAGIRFGGVKYMLTYHDAEKGATQLVSPDGGAVVASTTTSLVIGIFDKNGTSDGGAKQNVNSTFDQVVAMADYLKEQGI